jgi:MarR family transcriptional regulator, transcriptional regulator for hemolysin
MIRPRVEPIGRQLARSAKEVSHAFDRALADAGGSTPAWLILLALKTRDWETQAELARELGIERATLTHHLRALERDGLVTRERDPDNLRAQRMRLTAEGDAAFTRLREAAVRFDRRLRAGLGEDDLERLRELLGTLAANVAKPAG